MTEKHRNRLECLALVKHSAENAEYQYAQRGDRQMAIAHLRAVIRRAEIAMERLSADE